MHAKRLSLAGRAWRAPLRRREFRNWTAANFVSVTGAWMQQVAQSWLVLSQTGSGTAVGLTLAMQAGPSLVLGLWAGALADRYDRRRVLLVTQTAHALLAIALAICVHRGAAGFAVIQLFALASGIVAVFDQPASGALASTMLAPHELAAGLAIGGVVASTGRVVGLALAGVGVAALGPAAAFALNGLTFLAPIAVLLTLAPRCGAIAGERRTASLRGELGAGVAHVWRNDEARITLAAAWVLSCFGRNFQVTMALMAAQAFGSGAGLYGRFSSLFAMGALVGSLAAARLGATSRRVLAGSAALAAVLQVVSGIAATPMTFGLLLIPIAAGAVVLDTATSARVQLSTDPAMRGRVLSIAGLIGMTAGMVGGPLLGGIGQEFGPRAPLVVGGAIAAVAAAAYALARHGRPDPVCCAGAGGELRTSYG